MGNLFASFNTGVSGLHSAQSSLYTTAHNLSNATTKGYSRQQAMVTDHYYTTRFGAYGNHIQVGLGSNVAQIRQVRNHFLDAQYRNQEARLGFYEAQYKAVEEMEDLFGELEGEEFLHSFTRLKGALDELAKTPGDIVHRTELVSMASQFVEKASVLQNQLMRYQQNMNQEVQKQVDSINDIVEQVKDYNKLIRKYESTGESANDFRDSRNRLLDQLGEYIVFETVEEIDGTISIYAEGNYLLTANIQNRLATADESETSKLLKPIWQNGDDFFLRGELAYSSEDNTDTGSLKGLLVARGNRTADYTDMPVKPKEEDYLDEKGELLEYAYFVATKEYNDQVEDYNTNLEPSIVMKVQSEFDQMIHGIVTMVNDMLCPNKELTLADGTTIQVLDEEKAPFGDDADKTIGTELFVRRSTPRYTEKVVDVLDENGDSKVITVYQYNEEDVSDRYTLYTTDQLEVNGELLRNPSKLPLTANNNSGFVDGYTQDLCQDIVDKWGQEFSRLDPNSMTTYNFNDYYTALVGQFATDGNIWRGIVENQEITVHAVEGERQNVMGVSTDEELSDLIKYQQCYNASSRYITVVDEMIEHLINNL